MAEPPFKPRAHLKEGCPYSFKYLLFMAEAGLVDRIDVRRYEDESPEYEAAKEKLGEATGKQAEFPTVEIEPGRYMTDSDELIAHFARRHGIDAAKLPALSFYKETIFPQLEELH